MKYFILILIPIFAFSKPDSKSERPQLTKQQKECMDSPAISELVPGGEKPTHEQIITALTKCNVQIDERLAKLSRDYFNSNATDEQKESVRTDMKIIFHASESKEVKQKVRVFFSEANAAEKPTNSSLSSFSTANKTSSGTK